MFIFHHRLTDRLVIYCSSLYTYAIKFAHFVLFLFCISLAPSLVYLVYLAEFDFVSKIANLRKRAEHYCWMAYRFISRYFWLAFSLFNSESVKFIEPHEFIMWKWLEYDGGYFVHALRPSLSSCSHSLIHFRFAHPFSVFRPNKWAPIRNFGFRAIQCKPEKYNLPGMTVE